MVVFLLKKHGAKEKYTAKEISEKLNIPSPFLSKISQKLVKKGVISSIKGKGGGFFLTKENLKMSLFDVVLIFENEDVISKCVLGLRKPSTHLEITSSFSKINTTSKRLIFKFSLVKKNPPPFPLIDEITPFLTNF